MAVITNDPARRWLTWLAWLVGAPLILATLLPIANSNAWWVRNLIFPQVQITVLLVLLLALVSVLLGWRHAGARGLIVLVGVTIAYQLFYLLPYTPLAGRTVAAAKTCPVGNELRLIEANVRAGNDRHAPILNLVMRERPDLFFAVETDDAWRRALAPLRAVYPFVVAAPRDDYWGMMLFSRLPLSHAQVEHLVDDYVPSIRAEVRLRSGEGLVFHGLHPRPSMTHGSAKGDAELVRAGILVAREHRPALLTGDLNDVPWSSTAKLFGEVSGMRDPRVGRGFYASFDANSWWARWPLDHVFVTPDLGLLSFARLGDIGSDHFPMGATLCLLGPRQANGADALGGAWRRARQIIRTGDQATGK